ncbi:MAG: hypothetical protein IPL22_08555 [Bacteroidetes bacterium]|nr:hypothetical protein [Bacteroidota bacterium]
MALTKKIFAVCSAVVILQLLVLTSCKSPKASTVNEESTGSNADSLIAYLERTPCFGKCPYYSIRIYKSGYVVYEGKRDVDKIGRFQTMLTQDAIKELGQFALNSGFFELANEYRNPHLTDFPTIYIEVNYAGKKKKITHYDASPPDTLVNMENFIDALFSESTKWELHPIQDLKD